MLAKIKDILIVVNKGELNQFKKILPDGKRFGIKIQYIEQNEPKGLPDAFILGEKFINNQNVALILGDNFFYGQSLSRILYNCINIKQGAKILLHKVINPEKYGVAKLKNNKILDLVEKPKKFVSDFAITGLYFFDKEVVKYSKQLKPSSRNELEITDLLKKYQKNKKLKCEFIGRGGAWLDTGSIENFYKTSAFVSAIENQQGFKIACLEEIAYNNKWISINKIKEAIKFYGNCNYSNYLKKIIS